MALKELDVELIPFPPSVGVGIGVTSASLKRWPDVTYTWYREIAMKNCLIHPLRPAKVVCNYCASNGIEDYSFCSNSCFNDSLKLHILKNHPTPDLDFCKTSDVGLDFEGKYWMIVGALEFYVPTEEDIGFMLLLEVNGYGQCQRIGTVPVSSPHLRRFHHVAEQQGSEQSSFSVLSWNILADRLCSGRLQPHCPAWALSWDYRRQNILRELLSYDADIICLQEVEITHFRNFLEPELAKSGYSASCLRKSGDTEEKYDGLATFYRIKKLKQSVKCELEFDRSAEVAIDALNLEPRKAERALGIMQKHHVALVMILEHVDGQGSCGPICVANTHTSPNQDFPCVGLFQAVDLVRKLEAVDRFGIPIVVCGDFNCPPKSMAYLFITTGKIDSLPSKYKDPAIFERLPCHSINLKSLYATFFDSLPDDEHRKKMVLALSTKEPRQTHFSGTSTTTTLDYIFFTGERLILQEVLEILNEEDIKTTQSGRGEIFLLSPQWSSDHLPIMGKFSLKPANPIPVIPPDPWQGT